MKIRALPPHQSRILALSLLLGSVALIIAMITVPVLLLHRHYDQAIEQQLDLLTRYLRIGATAPSLDQQLNTLKTGGARSFFLKNSTPALAASEMQEIVKSVVENNGGKISSMQIPEHKDDGNYRKVTINVQMNAKISSAQKIFYTLETQRPYIILDNVSIRAAQAQRGANFAAPDAEFFVQLEATGYAVLGAK